MVIDVDSSSRRLDHPSLGEERDMLTGTCLCGAVAWEADAPAALITFCNCRTCRKASGTAFAANIRPQSGPARVAGVRAAALKRQPRLKVRQRACGRVSAGQRRPRVAKRMGSPAAGALTRLRERGPLASLSLDHLVGAGEK